MNKHPFSKTEFESIFSRVPRLNVEVVIRAPKGVILTKRGIEPCKGQWHIPGGTVRFGEPLPSAIKRVAEDELGVKVKVGRLIGYIEYPRMVAKGYKGWPVGIAFEVTILDGKLRGDEQGDEIGYFRSVPSNTVADQEEFLNKYIFI